MFDISISIYIYSRFYFFLSSLQYLKFLERRGFRGGIFGHDPVSVFEFFFELCFCLGGIWGSRGSKGKFVLVGGTLDETRFLE